MKKSGFTLIELLIVITILGVISLISIAAFRDSQEKGRDSIRKRDLTNLSIALEGYYQRFGQYIPGEGSCATDTTVFYNATTGIAPYMNDNVVPKDPKTGENYCYIGSTNGTSYRIFAKLESCTDSNLCNYSQYNYTIVSQNITPSSAPGDTPLPPTLKYVFVTSQTYNGNLLQVANALPGDSVATGLAAGDKICKHLADSSTIVDVRGRNWIAWLSDNNQGPSWRLPASNLPFRLVDKTTTIADNKNDLIDGNIDNKINKNELGGAVTGYTWTGTDEFGNGVGSTLACDDWTSSAASGTWALVGNTNSTAYGEWTWGDDSTCDVLKPIYCFEQ